MSQKTKTQAEFNFSYKADCITCKRYVGSERESKSEAEDDAEKHLSEPKNKDHLVEIEITQRS